MQLGMHESRQTTSSSISREFPLSAYVRTSLSSSLTISLSSTNGSEASASNLRRAERKLTIDGLDQTSCNSLFQSEIVLGKNG